MPEGAVSSSRRVAGVEGLRAIAATAVVGVHVWDYADPSLSSHHARLDGVVSNLALGVTLFFCLSGFLLYGAFVAPLLRGRPLPSIRAYFRNRALRILPAYWMVLLLAGVVIGVLDRPVSEGGALGRLTNVGTTLQMATFTEQLHPGTIWSGLGSAWTLSVEVVFYAVLPLLGLLAVASARRLPARAAALVPPALLLALGLAGRYACHRLLPGYPWQHDWHSVLEASFVAQCDLFSFGMVVAIVRTEVLDGRLALPRHWRRAAVPAALIALVVAMRHMGHLWQLSASGWNTVAALCLSVLLAAVVLPAPPGRRPVLALLEWRPVVWLGVISYSLFLWHLPVIDWMREHGLLLDGVRGVALDALLVLPPAIVAAALSYRFVERPALRRKKPVTAPRLAAEPGLVTN